MSNVKFLAAKELIQEGNYDEARAILETIDHPTADKWLRKIDNLDPPFPESDDEYYSEWFEEIEDLDTFSNSGWIAGINFPESIKDELSNYNIDVYINLGGSLDVVNWRTMAPKKFCEHIDNLIQKRLN